jgi:hypothetical protein
VVKSLTLGLTAWFLRGILRRIWRAWKNGHERDA